MIVLPKTYLSTCIIGNLITARSQVMVCCFTNSRTYASSTPKWLFCLQKLLKNNSSPFRIQMSIFHKPIRNEIYEVMVTKWNDWLGYCCQLRNLPPLSSFKFQFSPQRCDRQNVNEKLLHLFFSKIMRFITGIPSQYLWLILQSQRVKCCKHHLSAFHHLRILENRR